MRDWSKVTLETDPCVGFTSQAMVDFMDTVTVEVKRLSKAGMIEMTLCFCLLVLNIFLTASSIYEAYAFLAVKAFIRPCSGVKICTISMHNHLLLPKRANNNISATE